MSFEDILAARTGPVDRFLRAALEDQPLPSARISKAMAHGVLGGGKRLRPFLALTTAALFGVAEGSALRTAAAIECVHCYSLIHDDLPAMDDDDMRRGRPAVHIAFDEATAILAGDGLLTLAFEILANPETHRDGAVRAELIGMLARAAGPRGMIAGQMLDLEAEHTTLGRQETLAMQQLKTGELMVYSCLAGACLGGAAPGERDALRAYATGFGQAFQIADDLLDSEGSAADAGKKTGKDAGRGKATAVAVLGADGARAEANRLIEEAVLALDRFGNRAADLIAAARFVVARTH